MKHRLEVPFIFSRRLNPKSEIDTGGLCKYFSECQYHRLNSGQKSSFVSGAPPGLEFFVMLPDRKEDFFISSCNII